MKMITTTLCFPQKLAASLLLESSQKVLPRRKTCNVGGYFPFKKKDLLRLIALL